MGFQPVHSRPGRRPGHPDEADLCLDLLTGVGGIAEQAKQALDNLMKTLKEAGYGPENVIKVNVWLDDPRDFAIFNRVYSRYFTLEHAPARVTVQAHMMNDFKVEIDCVAWKAPR